MIGIDTNVLARVLVRDDDDQTAAALQFLSKRTADDPAFVSAVVVAELAWVLEKAYGYSAAAIFAATEWLLESVNIQVEHEELMELTLASAREANADLPAAIIAALAAAAGADTTVTFDRSAARRVAGTVLLT